MSKTEKYFHLPSGTILRKDIVSVKEEFGDITGLYSQITVTGSIGYRVTFAEPFAQSVVISKADHEDLRQLL